MLKHLHRHGIAAALLVCAAVQAQAAIVTPVKAVASSSHFTVTAQSLIDNSGMAGDLHGGAWDTMWIKEGTWPVDTTAALTFDLGALHDISAALVWQYNSDIDYTRGVKDFYVKTSTDGVQFSTVGDLRTLEQSKGGLIPAQLVSFSAQARFVQFDIRSNFDAQWPWVGLSEVKFVAAPVPEPGTYALMGLGLGAIGLLVRRRQQG